MEDFGHANVWADDDGGTTPSNVWGDLPSSHSGIGLASALELTPDAPAIEAALPPQNPLLHMPVYEIGFDAGVEMSGEEVSGAKYGELSVVETFQPHLGSTLNEYVGASSLPVEDPSAEAFRRSSISAAADNASIVPLPPSLKSPSEDESDEVTDIGISNIPMPVQSVPVQYDPLTASVMETTPIHSLLLRGKSSGSRNDAPRAAYNSSSNSTVSTYMPNHHLLLC
ncbi:hypothetical protein BC832DRAFT_211921 [Gaertneriomyces semiglobifer]|nr:hypothetical protein BC832DRAFT_211921 [Gaertneriomyces semiglobifer]